MDRKAIHRKVLEAQTTEELMAAYKLWADHYDTDLLSEMGYRAPANTMTLFTKLVTDKSTPILDVGCGTGIIGSMLKSSGYSLVDGLDYSKDMLAQARQKEVYQSLIQADLTKPLSLDSAHYGAIVSVGMFTLGHVGPDALTELIRITRPGGILCFTVRQEAWEEHEYRRYTIDLELKGKWELQQMETVTYIEEEGSLCKLVAFSVSK